MEPLHRIVIFIGEDKSPRRQFHVVLSITANLLDLQLAVQAHEGMPSEDQLILNGASAIMPGFSLLSQGIGNFACLHLHDLAQMRAESRHRAEQIRLDKEKRGRYTDKSGKVKLRRKSRRKSDNSCPPKDSAQTGGIADEKRLPGIETLFAVAGKYRCGSPIEQSADQKGRERTSSQYERSGHDTLDSPKEYGKKPRRAPLADGQERQRQST